MRYNEILTEMSRQHPMIVVDVQPEYLSFINMAERRSFMVELANMLWARTGPTLMYINGTETGMTDDTIEETKTMWMDHGLPLAKLNRFEWFDKGYGYFRSWMDAGVDDRIIVQVIREMYRQRVYSSEELFDGDGEELIRYIQSFLQKSIHSYVPAVSVLIEDPITVGWVAVNQLKRYSGSYLCGGGYKECLKELTLLMNAFNVKYKILDRYVYGKHC